ncbi:hypothetical protein OnM2_072080 [Erysiphe neolycopersici]|uniref:Uncharacterized protein n=1 Tax=Erysiphe neolycopersici TaxID=212602 RepID=A0A420HK12_9PEZI|nr:hypothetical protein OnM2_072080 [Erysiphe neolycopersici]
MVRHDCSTKAQCLEVRFVDPEINDYDRPKLVITVKSTPEDVKDPKEDCVVTKFSELDAEGRDEFRDLKEEHNAEKRMCEKQTEALADLRFRIQETVHISSNFTYTKGCSSAYEMLRNIADKFLTSDVHRKQELKLRWKNLFKTLDDTEPIYDFLNALNTLESSYAHTKASCTD